MDYIIDFTLLALIYMFFYKKWRRKAKIELILNIIMLMPFGFLYPIIRRAGIMKTISMTFLFSLAIESYQLYSCWCGSYASRIFDITDLITNTIGGLIGYIIYTILRPLITMILNKFHNE